MRSLFKVTVLLMATIWLASCSKSDIGPPVFDTGAFVKFTVDGKKYTHSITGATYRDSTLIISSNAVIPQGNFQFALKVTIHGQGTYSINGDGDEPDESFLSLADGDINEGHWVTGNGYSAELQITSLSESSKSIRGVFSGTLVFNSHGNIHHGSTLEVTDGSFLVYFI